MMESIDNIPNLKSLECRPVESYIVELLQDDRLLTCAESLQKNISDEINYIGQLPMPVFQEFASLVDDRLTAIEYKELVMRAAHASAAFVDNDAFRKVRQYPYKLTQGDMEKNLEELAALDFDCIVDPTTKKIWILLDIGWDRAALLKALKLLRDLPFSVQLCEKAHGSGAKLMALHQAYGSRFASIEQFHI